MIAQGDKISARTRRLEGNWPALLSHGFRPFFLFGALYGGLIIVAWLPIRDGTLGTGSAFTPLDWHIHETLFGYLTAIVAGFLFTAIPNWTGRLPVRGAPLLCLLLLWIGGRITVFFSASTGWLAAAVIDNLFLMAVSAAAATEIVAGRNWRNLKVLIPVTVLLLANVLFHVEAATSGTTDYSRRLATAAAIALILIIGGRIIPSFTRNWLARENPGRLPVPFNNFDALSIILSVAALLFWALAPENAVAGFLLIAAAIVNVARLMRWAGDRAWRDTLVLILHVAYFFVPVGLFLAGLAALDPDRFPPVAGLHALGVGAIGVMTLAVMTRASLGHTGRVLRADIATRLIYAAIVLAALTRIVAGFHPEQAGLLHASATLWTLAFLGFCARYGGMLLQPRLKHREPNRAPTAPTPGA